jgi:hypothetical protein
MQTTNIEADDDIVINATLNLISLREKIEEITKIVAKTWRIDVAIKWWKLVAKIDAENTDIMHNGTWEETDRFATSSMDMIDRFLADNGLQNE